MLITFFFSKMIKHIAIVQIIYAKEFSTQNRKIRNGDIVMHCGIVLDLYCPSQQYVAESGNVA